MIIKDLNVHPLNWKIVHVLETHPHSKKGIVRQFLLKAAAKENLLRAVHQFVSLPPEEEKAAENFNFEDVYTPRKGRIPAFINTLLCLYVLLGNILLWYIDPVLESEIVEVGKVQMKAFELYQRTPLEAIVKSRMRSEST